MAYRNFDRSFFINKTKFGRKELIFAAVEQQLIREEDIIYHFFMGFHYEKNEKIVFE